MLYCILLYCAHPEPLEHRGHPDVHVPDVGEEVADAEDEDDKEDLQQRHVEDGGGRVVVQDVEHEDAGGEAHGEAAAEGEHAARDVDERPAAGGGAEAGELVQDGGDCGLPHAHDGGHGEQDQHQEEEEVEEGRHGHEGDGLGVGLEGEAHALGDHVCHRHAVILIRGKVISIY